MKRRGLKRKVCRRVLTIISKMEELQSLLRENHATCLVPVQLESTIQNLMHAYHNLYDRGEK